jgi:hypothetical protein
MAQECIICENNNANYCIKGMDNYSYCKECALQQFSDVSLLQRL